MQLNDKQRWKISIHLRKRWFSTLIDTYIAAKSINLTAETEGKGERIYANGANSIISLWKIDQGNTP